MSLYKGSEVVELNAKDFTISGNQVTCNHPEFKKDGCIMIYAPWCPHCQDKTSLIKFIDKYLKYHPELEFKIGVVNGDDPQNQPLTKALGLQGFPTFYHLTCKSGSNTVVSEFTSSGFEMLDEFKKFMNHEQSGM